MSKSIISHYLDLINVKHSSYPDIIFENHPLRDSLYGIYEVLSSYNLIINKIRYDQVNIIPISYFPFITTLYYRFIIVKSIKNNTVNFILDGKEHDIDINEFNAAWSGLIINAQRKNDSNEPFYNLNLKKDIIKSIFKCAVIASAILSLCILIILSSKNQTIVSYIILILSLFGFSFCYLLFSEENHKKTSRIKRLCSLIKNGNCEIVTKSNAANVLGIFKLSEVGLSFFLVNIYFIALYPENINILLIFFTLSILLSFWSISYQYFIVKHWCLICILIFGIIWLESIFLFAFNNSNNFISTTNLLLFFLISSLYILCTFVFHIIGRLLGIKKEVNNIEAKYNKLKFNPKIFQTIQESMQSIELKSEASNLIFGNPNSQNTLIVFSNPFCKPCSYLHKQLETIINKDCRIEIIFGYFDKEKSLINKKLIASYFKYGSNNAWEIITDWFKQKDKTLDFFNKYDLDIENELIENESNLHNYLIENLNIEATPTILFNGRFLSNQYDINDLSHFLNVSIE